MRVLFVSSEAYPLAKTGGLADVSAALPMALAELGVDVRLVMPGYDQALSAAANKVAHAKVAHASLDDPGPPMQLISARMPDTGLPVWLVDTPTLFRRSGGPYQDESGQDWPDNAQRFSHFSQVVARIAADDAGLDWQPDVVHTNDWHTGLVPLLLQDRRARPATLFTIHNLAYQGIFPAATLADLGLPGDVFTSEGIEFHGQVSFLKAGIRYSDRLSTVSPSYAREIMTPEQSCGLDGLLHARACHLHGILNGVDYRLWNPGDDIHLAQGFTSRDLSGKRACKAELQRELGLDVDPDIPLIVSLSRITHQKMADVVLDALPAILDRPVQFALLGDGDRGMLNRFAETARNWPGRLAARSGYTEPGAHRLLAGGDLLLHPSRFEPCGLTPLYALCYGTLPVASEIGGLTDTIVDATSDALRSGTANGFAFREATASVMVGALDRALALYRQPVAWRRMQTTAMAQDFGWNASAQHYLAIYRKLAPHARPSAISEEQMRELPVV
jgi:starch synthase